MPLDYSKKVDMGSLLVYVNRLLESMALTDKLITRLASRGKDTGIYGRKLNAQKIRTGNLKVYMFPDKA